MGSIGNVSPVVTATPETVHREMREIDFPTVWPKSLVLSLWRVGTGPALVLGGTWHSPGPTEEMLLGVIFDVEKPHGGQWSSRFADFCPRTDSPSIS